jgi:hypothetical protein
MRDDIWIEDDEPRRKPRSVLGVVTIAAVPWLIVAGMVLLPDRDAPPSDGPGIAEGELPGDQSDGEAADDDGEDGSAEDPAADPPVESTLPDETDADGASAEAPATGQDEVDPPAGPAPAAGGRDVTLDRLLAATATVVARAWATGVDPHLDIPGVDPADGARYAEHVAIESIQRFGSEFAVVTLIAVVLEDLEEGIGAELRRLAVPLVVEDGAPRLAGVPWWLAPPRIASAEPPREWVPSTEVEADAEAALHAAGYSEVEVASVHRTAGWPWVVEFVGLTPGGEPVAGEVWLRLENDRFVLAGEPVDEPMEGGGR